MANDELPTDTDTRSVDGRVMRGSLTRDRLLRAATEIFFRDGYRAASTRDICLAAQVNPAAIHYHFTDKAGLYRAVMLEPFNAFGAMQQLAELERTPQPFEQSIARVYGGILAPMRSGDPILMQQIRMHYREIAEPSGVLGDVVLSQCERLYDAVTWLVRSELSIAESDNDLRRLVFCMLGMAFDFYGSQVERDRFAPTMLCGAGDVDLLVERLTMFACAMVSAERARRQTAAGSA